MRRQDCSAIVQKEFRLEFHTGRMRSGQRSRWQRELKMLGKNLVVILSDSGERYLSSGIYSDETKR